MFGVKSEDKGALASEQTGDGQSKTEQSADRLIELTEENKRLVDLIKEVDDKYKRSLAEAENTRIRMRRQVDEAKIYGIQSFCKDLLEVADVLSTALQSVPPEAIDGDNKVLKSLFSGLEMTEKQLQTVFRRHGLTQINPLGQKFDPNSQHALFEVVDADKEPGSVAIVTKIGYKLHDRTIRPAMVGVVKTSKEDK